jgi:hypothetical protein
VLSTSSPVVFTSDQSSKSTAHVSKVQACNSSMFDSVPLFYLQTTYSWTTFAPTISSLVASSPFAWVPPILVPGRTIVGGKCDKGGRREAAVTLAFCCNTMLLISHQVQMSWSRLDLLHDDEGGHGFHDGYGSGNDTWVVSTFGG